MGLDWPNTPGAWLGLWMLSASVASSGLFYMDKHRARAGGERVPEIVLKGSMLLYGWPGGFAGMRLFHNKTRKFGAMFAYWPIFAAEAGILVLLLLRF